MDQKEMTVSQPATQELSPVVRGPVELDPSLFGFVSGGLPNNTWGAASTSSNATTTS